MPSSRAWPSAGRRDDGHARPRRRRVEAARVSRPRVLHVITRLTLGGSAENTVASTLALMRAGYPCTLAAGLAESDADVVADARRRGCAVIDVPALGREVR